MLWQLKILEQRDMKQVFSKMIHAILIKISLVVQGCDINITVIYVN